MHAGAPGLYDESRRNVTMPKLSPSPRRLLVLAAALGIVANLALSQGAASSAPVPAGDLTLARTATLLLLCDPGNPLRLDAAETAELRPRVMRVVEGLERSLLRQTYLYDDLEGRWVRLAGPKSQHAPERAFLKSTEAAEARLRSAVAGELLEEPASLDVIDDHWLQDVLPERERLSLEELGRLLDDVSRDCTADEAARVLPELQALRQEVRQLGIAWSDVENRLDSPKRAALIAERTQQLESLRLPDVREAASRWAETD